MPAYNNYYPATYQPYVPVYQQQQSYVQQPQQLNNQGVNWVQGEAGAKSWLIAPNTSVILMDSEANVFYLKSADASGVPLPLRIFDYVERSSDTNKAIIEDSKCKTIDYATKEDLDTLKSQIKDEITEMFSGAFTNKKRKNDNE